MPFFDPRIGASAKRGHQILVIMEKCFQNLIRLANRQ